MLSSSKVKQLVQNYFEENKNIEFGYIFGSYADETFNDRSDVDEDNSHFWKGKNQPVFITHKHWDSDHHCSSFPLTKRVYGNNNAFIHR